MIKEGDIAYYALDKGSEKIIKRAHNFRSEIDRKKVGLLWGDEVYVVSVRRTRATVSARGWHLDVALDRLMEKPLLSLYQIDCGQGDAALLQFPDGKWMMVDGGPPDRVSNSGTTAIDFLKWKVFVDQSWRREFKVKGAFRLDAVVCSHPDQDHYGGFEQLLDMVKPGKFEIGTYFHNGMGRFSGTAAAMANGKGFGQLGPVRGTTEPDLFLTTLIDGFKDVRRYKDSNTRRSWKLGGNYTKILKRLERMEGIGVDSMQRLDHTSGTLPGFPNVHVLGPILEKWNNQSALRFLDGASKSALADPSLTRNGQSVVLRADYGDVKLMLTGDLNFRSQALLLKHHDSKVFQCHVAKACHHGSEDISWKFLQAMSPIATLFSSGDNEKYAHPRAKAVGLAAAYSQKRKSGAKTKYAGFSEDELESPLIYSTELSRSVVVADIHSVYDAQEKRVRAPRIQAEGRTKNTRNKGDRRRHTKWKLADRLVYGLINVRTDGKRVVIGVYKEDRSGFHIEAFDA